jgi:hypothetical protein
MKGPPQVHGRSVRGHRKLARHRPARSRRRSMHSAVHAQARQAQPAARHGRAAQIRRHGARRHSSAPVQGDIPISAGCSRLPPGSRGPRVAQTVGPPVIVRAWRALNRGQWPSKSRKPKRFGVARLLGPRIRPRRPPDRVHDRGRCPLYVRAQLETAGLAWIQRDQRASKTTTRDTPKIQVTGRFRW